MVPRMPAPLMTYVGAGKWMLIGTNSATPRSFIKTMVALMTVDFSTVLMVFCVATTLKVGLVLDLVFVLSPVFLVSVATSGVMVGLMPMRHSVAPS